MFLFSRNIKGSVGTGERLTHLLAWKLKVPEIVLQRLVRMWVDVLLWYMTPCGYVLIVLQRLVRMWVDVLWCNMTPCGYVLNVLRHLTLADVLLWYMTPCR
jgi:hypothetical protein